MRSLIRFFLTGLFCVVASVSAVHWLASLDSETRGRPVRARHPDAAARAPGSSPKAAQGPGSRRDAGPIAPVELREFERAGFDVAIRFTGPIRDPRSLRELREAIRG